MLKYFKWTLDLISIITLLIIILVTITILILITIIIIINIKINTNNKIYLIKTLNNRIQYNNNYIW